MPCHLKLEMERRPRAARRLGRVTVPPPHPAMQPPQGETSSRSRTTSLALVSRDRKADSVFFLFGFFVPGPIVRPSFARRRLLRLAILTLRPARVQTSESTTSPRTASRSSGGPSPPSARACSSTTRLQQKVRLAFLMTRIIAYFLDRFYARAWCGPIIFHRRARARTDINATANPAVGVRQARARAAIALDPW